MNERTSIAESEIERASLTDARAAETKDRLFRSAGHWASPGRWVTTSHPLGGLYNASSSIAGMYFVAAPLGQEDIEIDPALGMSVQEAARRGHLLTQRLGPGIDVDLGDGA